jgi:AmmeMemoRadiSam system protein B
VSFTPHSRPRLREGLSVGKDETGLLCLWDPHRIGGPPVPVSPPLIDAARWFTGERTIAEIHATLQTKHGTITIDELVEFTHIIDTSLFIDGDTLRAYLTGRSRRPSCIGCYPPDPEGVRETARELFTAPGGPGLPDFNLKPTRKLRAALLPHMDYARGNVTYGWGFKELLEQTTASLFVIVATSHYSPERFTLTRMNFSSPLGTVETDQQYIDRLVHHFGDERQLFRDPFAHLPEHSIELEVVVLQAMLEGVRPFRIVPLLCGGYGDVVKSGRPPKGKLEIKRMIAALGAAEAEAGEEVCYLISGDLAHIGPKFDDPVPVDEPWLKRSADRDQILLDKLTAVDAEGYFSTIAEEGDERRICGLPPTYLALEAARPKSGNVLHYQQYFDPTGFESVSFASAAFYA